MVGPLPASRTRVSTPKQVKSGSLERQRRMLIDQAKERGYDLLCICEDAGLSDAEVRRRKGLHEAMRLAERERLPILVTWNDRFAREPRLWAEAQRRGITVIETSEEARESTTRLNQFIRVVMTGDEQRIREYLGVRS